MLEHIHETDVWDVLSTDAKPVVLYGMGDGAEKIMKVLARYGIAVSDIFASDEYIRGHSFKGFHVQTYSQICEKYKDFNVVMAFAVHDRPMLERIQSIAREHAVFAPDVPVAGDGLFTRAFVQQNEEKFDRVYNMLADETSRRVYLDILRFKISGKVQYLYDSFSDKAEVYKDILKLSKKERIVDLGAYDGDTIREFLACTDGHYEQLLALEPDAKNFKKLEKNTASLEPITCLNLGAWKEKTTLLFNRKAGRNSKLGEGGVPIEVDTVDHLCDFAPTMIKMDIEGAELCAIEGAAQTIQKHHPKLYICAYHRNEDLFSIPLKVTELYDGYRVFFRHVPYIPAWESNFYFTI